MSIQIGEPIKTSTASAAQAGAPCGTAPRTWDSCAALPQSEVPLAELAEGLRLDDGCAEPIRYLADRGLLCYRGRMSHASFVHLQGLSRDRRYNRALEELFVATSMPPTPPAARKVSLWVAAGVAAALLAAAWLGWRGLGRSTGLNSLPSETIVASDSTTDATQPVRTATALHKETAASTTGGQQ